MTDSCTLLDSYLDGSLTRDQAERFENHAADCHSCSSALALPADLGDALAELAEVSCPPDVLDSALAETESEWPDAWSREARGLADTVCPPAVLDAALRQVRRAPDRAPRRTARRVATRWAVGLAVLVAIVLAWSLRSPSEPTAPRLAQTPAVAPPESETPLLPAPLPEPTEVEAVPLVAEVAPLEPVAPSEPLPAPAAPAPTPTVLPDESVAEGQEPLVSDPEAPSQEAIDAARDDLALAFRLVDRAQTQARSAVRDETGALSSTIEHTLPF